MSAELMWGLTGICLSVRWRQDRNENNRNYTKRTNVQLCVSNMHSDMEKVAIGNPGSWKLLPIVEALNTKFKKFCRKAFWQANNDVPWK